MTKIKSKTAAKKFKQEQKNIMSQLKNLIAPEKFELGDLSFKVDGPKYIDNIEYIYNNDGTLKMSKSTKNGTSIITGYKYNDSGKIQSVYFYRDGDNPSTEHTVVEYEYDSDDRLVKCETRDMRTEYQYRKDNKGDYTIIRHYDKSNNKPVEYIIYLNDDIIESFKQEEDSTSTFTKTFGRKYITTTKLTTVLGNEDIYSKEVCKIRIIDNVVVETEKSYTTIDNTKIPKKAKYILVEEDETKLVYNVSSNVSGKWKNIGQQVIEFDNQKRIIHATDILSEEKISYNNGYITSEKVDEESKTLTTINISDKGDWTETTRYDHKSRNRLYKYNSNINDEQFTIISNKSNCFTNHTDTPVDIVYTDLCINNYHFELEKIQDCFYRVTVEMLLDNGLVSKKKSLTTISMNPLIREDKIGSISKNENLIDYIIHNAKKKFSELYKGRYVNESYCI